MIEMRVYKSLQEQGDLAGIPNDWWGILIGLTFTLYLIFHTKLVIIPVILFIYIPIVALTYKDKQRLTIFFNYLQMKKKYI